MILTDFSSEPYSVPAHAAVAAILAPVSDAVLVGEHQDRPDFPPAQLASILQQAGARPWITLSCRDRNRVVLEQELRGLRELGVGAVLCVTGDARAYDVRPDVTQVFDLDGPRLAALAASTGMTAAFRRRPPRRPGTCGPSGWPRSSAPGRRSPCSTTTPWPRWPASWPAPRGPGSPSRSSPRWPSSPIPPLPRRCPACPAWSWIQLW